MEEEEEEEEEEELKSDKNNGYFTCRPIYSYEVKVK